MTSFDDRQNTFEKKFAHDQELAFKITARRAHLLGEWVTEKLGLSGTEGEAYIQELVKLDCTHAGDEEVFGKIRSDFDANGVDQSDHQIRRTMDDMMETASQQIATQKG
ncbi:MAG: DUF1476 domain-containing protein [Parvularculales bacterium]